MKNILVPIILIIAGVLLIVQGLFLIVEPDHEEGVYTMTYKVYYSPNDSKTYTITNNWPIGTYSSRGTNTIYKLREMPILKNAFGTSIVFESSAPIEVVKYTYKKR